MRGTGQALRKEDITVLCGAAGRGGGERATITDRERAAVRRIRTRERRGVELLRAPSVGDYDRCQDSRAAAHCPLPSLLSTSVGRSSVPASALTTQFRRPAIDSAASH